MPRRAPASLDERALAGLLRVQDGVVSINQLRGLGCSRAELRRLLGGRWLVPLHPGVYVNHTGSPTRRQREWAAVLLCSPAALHRESALDAHGMTRDRPDRAAIGRQEIHLLVGRDRRLTPPPGIRIERAADHTRWVLDNRRPPRAAFDFAVLKAASARSEADAVALLSDAVHQGFTTAPRLLAVLAELTRLPQRSVLVAILTDVAAGTRSVLERRYLREVEVAHALPEGTRQLRRDTPSGVVHRDVGYLAHRTLVELDGAFGHRDSVDRWADLQRDLDAVADDVVTLRAGWAQVLEPCRLAATVARVLQRRGWDGSPAPCGPACVVADGGVSGPT